MANETIKFKAWVLKNEQRKGYFCGKCNGVAYRLLRLICYPLTKQYGPLDGKIVFTLKMNGNLMALVEQRQLQVSDFSALDLELAKYYFLLDCGEATTQDIDPNERDDYECVIVEIGARVEG